MFEIRIIRAVAALYRAVIALSLRTLKYRFKVNQKRLAKRMRVSQELLDLSKRAKEESATVLIHAQNNHAKRVKELRSAEHVILNLQDDLNRVTND